MKKREPFCSVNRRKLKNSSINEERFEVKLGDLDDESSRHLETEEE